MANSSHTKVTQSSHTLVAHSSHTRAVYSSHIRVTHSSHTNNYPLKTYKDGSLKPYKRVARSSHTKQWLTQVIQGYLTQAIQNGFSHEPYKGCLLKTKVWLSQAIQKCGSLKLYNRVSHTDPTRVAINRVNGYDVHPLWEAPGHLIRMGRVIFGDRYCLHVGLWWVVGGLPPSHTHSLPVTYAPRFSSHLLLQSVLIGGVANNLCKIIVWWPHFVIPMIACWEIFEDANQVDYFISPSPSPFHSPSLCLQTKSGMDHVPWCIAAIVPTGSYPSVPNIPSLFSTSIFLPRFCQPVKPCHLI